MSSMRNAVQRRVHRERAQPAGREKWGILEKHKDYSLRAKDYNVKKAKLQRLREKARDRNPDEFAYGMMSERSWTQGKHGSRESKSLSHETVQLLKTQDAGYLRVAGERVRRQLDQISQEARLQDSLQDVEDGEGGGKKVVFVDSVEDQRQRALDDDEEEEEDNEEEETANRRRLSKKELVAERRARKEKLTARKMKQRAAESRAKKLEALTLQHEHLTAAERELSLQRDKISHSVGGVNKYGVKWKVRERKR